MKFVATTKAQLQQQNKKHYSLKFTEAEQESKRINNFHAVNLGTLDNVSLCSAVKFAKEKNQQQINEYKKFSTIYKNWKNQNFYIATS